MTATKSTDPNISCPAAIVAGKVCAHAVTVTDLQGWGIDVRHMIADHIYEGTILASKAVHQAWQQGHVRMCTLDPRTMIRHSVFENTPGWVADTLAWCETHLRKEDRT